MLKLLGGAILLPLLLHAAEPAPLTLEPGTRIPLSLLNSISTKQAVEGDRVYLTTIFPIMIKGRIAIPTGSYVAGTVTHTKRPGRVKGRGELYLRFDSLTLPNGVTRDFRARMGTMDAETKGQLDRKEGRVRGEGDIPEDIQKMGQATVTGASVGTVAGAAAGRSGLGAGLGAAAGAAAGVMAVLLSRGPDVLLAKGSTLEMTLDREISFEPRELDFDHPLKKY